MSLPAAVTSGTAWRREIKLPRLLDPADAAALGGLALIVAVLCWPLLAQGRVYWERDLHLYLYPRAESFVRVLAQGSLPLWNPYVAFGEPLLANPQMQVFYPPTWLQLFMQPWTWYAAFVATHLLFTAAGAYLCARRLRLSRAGALLAGSAWITSGPLLSTVNLYHHFAGAAWIPWVLAASDAALERHRARDVVGCGVVIALQVLTGSADMCVLGGVLAAANALRHLTLEAGAPRRSGRLLLTGAFALGIGLALSAAQWIPTLEIARRSSRADLPERIRTYWSAHPATLAQMVLPVTLHELPLSEAVRAALYESREPFLISLYVGLAAAVLVLAAIVRRRSARPILLLLLLLVLGALGRHTPFLAALTTVIAPLGVLRYPVKAMVPAALLWAVLAGQGLDALRDPADRRSRITFLAVALALVAAAGTIAITIGSQPDRWAPLLLRRTPLDPPFAAAVVPAAWRIAWATALALAVWAVAAAKPSPARWRTTAVALAVAADLVIANSRLNRTCAPELMAWRPPAVDAVRVPDGRRIYSYDYFPNTLGRASLTHPPYALAAEPSDPVMGAVALRGALFPSVLSEWGVESSYDLDQQGLFPKEMATLARLLRLVEGQPGHLKLLRVGAVSRVAAMHTAGFEDLPVVATLPTLFRERLRIYSVPDPVPRAYVVGGVVVADGDEALAALQSATFDPLREVVLPAGAAAAPPAVPPGECRVLAWTADRIRLEASMRGPGVLVLVDAYDPGWRTSVDGQPATLLRANVAFRGLALPPGRHVIESVYRPPAVRLGLAVSALAAMALAGVALSAAGRRHGL